MSRQSRRHLACSLVLAFAASVSSAAEHAAVLELGAELESNLPISGARLGPSLAMEVTPIEDLLELELGAATSRSHRATEWETDLLFKKPWTWSPTVEFMAGLGPSWTRSSQPGGPANTAGGELALDFMFWPTRKWGWFLEPSYGVDFAHGHPKSLSLSVGVLLGIDK